MKNKRVREASDPTIVVHNPPPTEEMAEFAVKQEFKKDCDINELFARFNKGIHPPAWMSNKTPIYGDFTDLPVSFQEAFAMVEEAQEAFMTLPLEMRKELDHDPRNLDFADRKLFEKYGLTLSSVKGQSEPEANGGSSPQKPSSSQPVGKKEQGVKADSASAD